MLFRSNGDTVQMTGTSISKPRVDTSAGATELTLTGPNIGTIVGDSLIINGGDITIKNPIDPATGLPLITDAQNTQVNAGNAQAGDGSGTTTGVLKPLAVENAQAIKYSDGEGTDTSGAGAGAGSNGGAGDTGSAGTPIAGNGDGPAPTPPARGLNLKDPIFQTPEGAVAVLMGAGFSPQWSDWSQLRVVPGGLSANDLQLNLSGQFINHGRLDVTNQLIINAAQGIDNFGASISAGGTASLNGKYLNNDNGLIQAGTLVTDIKGDISNNRGRIVASNGGFLKADGNISATEGQFISDAGKFVLDAGGDVDLIASKVVGKQGVGINAGGNVNLGVKQTTQTTHADKNSRELQAWNNSATGSDTFVEGVAVIDSRQTSTSTATTSVGTTIDSADGSVAIAAGGKLAITGGSINAGQDVLLRGAEVSVRAARDTTVTEQAQSRTVDGRVTDSQTSTTHSESYSGGTVTAGGKVAVIANIADGDTSKGSGNVLLAGSRIEGKQGVTVSASGNVDLQALQATSTTTSSGQQGNFVITHTAGQSTAVSQHSAAVSSSEGDVKIVAKGDVNVIGSNVSAKQDLVLLGNNVTVESSKERVATSDEAHRKGYDHARQTSQETLAGGEITAGRNIVISATGKPQPVVENASTGTGDAGDPIAKKPTATDSSAGDGNINLKGATVVALGDVSLIAGNNINVLDQHTESHAFEAEYKKTSGFLSKKTSTSQSITDTVATVGSQVSGKNVLLQAGQVGEDGKLVSGSGDIKIQGSDISASDKVTLNAGRDILIVPGQGTLQESHEETRKRSGLSASFMDGISVGTSSSKGTGTSSQTINVGSRIQGGDIQMQAGRDATIQASQVIADRDIDVKAGRNINITAARDIQNSDYASSSRSTGVGLMPGLSASFTVFGQNSTEQNGKDRLGVGTTSVLSANAGTLTLRAGTDEQYKGTGQGNVTTQGADLLAKERVSISGNAVDLQAVETTHESEDHLRSKSLVVGARPAGMLGAVINTADAALQSARSGSNRLAGANALKAGYDAYKYSLNGATSERDAARAVFDKGGDDKAISPDATRYGVSVSISASETRQDSSQSSTTQRGTNIQASNIDITANEGDITMHGAKLQAENIALDAAKNIHLLAIQNTQQVQSSSSSSGGGLGVTVALGEQSGVSFQANYGQSRNRANGTETVHDNTQIIAGNRLSIKSGGDTELRGAQVAGKQVSVDVGGNLTIETLQDKTTYEMQQSSSGFNVSLCIPPICYGNPVTGSVNVSRTELNHNYQSAVGQSGISAGEGGYDIKVAGNTHLTGGAITSTAEADKNQLQTQSLTFSDLTNTQDTHVSTSSIGLAYGSGSALSTLAANAASNLLAGTAAQAGLPEAGSDRSQTQSVISPGKVTITGQDADGSNAQAVATLTQRDPETADQGLTNRLTLVQAQQIEANQREAQENLQAANIFGGVAAGVVGDVAEAKEWKDGSPEKVALHGMVGAAVAAMGGGNAGIGLLTGAANELAVGVMADYLVGLGYVKGTPEFNELMKVGSAALGTLVGKAAGGNATDVAVSGQLAKGATENNYLKHTDVDKLSKALRKCEDQACRDSAMLEAYTASAKNDVELLNCNATANCDELIAEYRKGYAAIQNLVDAGVDDNTLGHIFNMEDSASRMIGTGAYKKQCVTAECVTTAQYLVGIGTGLSNITPAGVAVGTVDAAYQLINSIANRGLTETTIAIVKGIQGLPENIIEGLNSTDPKVRGETLVNALLITGVATTVGPKIGVKILENAGTGPSAGSRAAQRGGVKFGGDADSGGGKTGSGGASPKPPAAVQGGTVELFTDSRGPQVPGAVGVGPTTPGAVALDATNMPTIPSGSQARVVANNPYIPPKAGGTFMMMDYLPEATRITQSGGEIVINGTQANKYLTNIPTAGELDALGLTIKYKGPLLPEYQGVPFLRTDGSKLTDPMFTIVFVKK